MEEADLLKERLQAITDKRRVQEDIAKKRTEIDEEKLKLQYIKKKALREQWLMDGLSQQTEEEQENLRLQVEDEREQSALLQSNIDRIDKEIVALETHELDISDNEKDILRRLKEVERTPDDIIKELLAELRAGPVQPSPVSQTLLTFQPTPPKKSTSPKLLTNEEEPKKAMFAMEISVERDMRTGESQVVATATVTPEAVSERGVKVYEDGRKSVYALRQGGGSPHGDGALPEMTPVEVEELLRQATDTKVPSEVQYHHPVYSQSSLNTGNSSRPSTPRTPGAKSPQQTTAPDQMSSLMGNIVQSSADQPELRPDPGALPEDYKTPSPAPFRQASTLTDKTQTRGETKQILSHIPSQTHNHAHNDPYNDKYPLSHPQSPPRPCARTTPILTNGHSGYTTSLAPVALVSVTARPEGMPAPMHPVYKVQGSRITEGWTTSGDDGHSPAPLIETIDFDRRSPLYPESEASLNFVNSLPGDLESEPVTMIFMGYQTAEDEEEEEEDIQAELVVIGEEDEDCADEFISYHPEGYTSKVFRPQMGVAKLGGCRGAIGQTYPHCDDLLPVKPTFTHKPGQRSPAPCPGGQVPGQPPITGIQQPAWRR